MTVMTNFRAQDMPGNQKPAAATPAPKKVVAPAKTKVEAVVETPAEEVEEAPAE
jgi:hypothetical protein